MCNALPLAPVVTGEVTPDGAPAQRLQVVGIDPLAELADGSLVPLAEQDRARWDTAMVAEGAALIESTMAWAPLGPYQLQAAIAALHATAPGTAETDWAQIAVLYRILERLAPSPVVTVNRAVAVAEAEGVAAGLALLAEVADDPRLAGYHRFPAVRGHLLERVGDLDGAREAYRLAAKLTLSTPEKRYLEHRATALSTEDDQTMRRSAR